MRLPRLSRILAAIAIAGSIGASAPSIALGKQPVDKGDPKAPAAAAHAARGKIDGKAGGKAGGKADAIKTDAARTKGKAGREGRGTQSIGAPNRGRLTGGMRLRPTKHIALRPAGRTWALPVLVRLLRRASEDVAKRHRGSIVLIGDLSAKAGGPIEGHASHQSGRDADIGFFVANTKGKPVPVKRFIAFDSSGKGRDFTWARFDDARNWTLIEALIKDEQAVVRYIFVTTALRARLLAYAAKKQVAKELIARAAAVMMSPKEAEQHDDHFHVRVMCPESMLSVCMEESLTRDGAPVIAAASAGTGTATSAGSGESGAAESVASPAR